MGSVAISLATHRSKVRASPASTALIEWPRSCSSFAS